MPLCSTPLVYGLLYFLNARFFAIKIDPAAIPLDLGLQILLGFILLSLSRRLWLMIPVQALFMSGIYLGSAAKLTFFGAPITPDDLFVLRNLFQIMEGPFWLLTLLLYGLPPVLFLVNLRFRPSGVAALIGILSFWGVLMMYPTLILNSMDERLGNVVWDQRGNYLHRGGTVYLLQETARFFAERDAIATPERIESAAQYLLVKNHGFRGPVQQRNVHVIVLESFWDPMLLDQAGLSHDPMDPDFRALWALAGNAHALSPVFGGYTANAEFEALCGFPVVRDSVDFENRLYLDAPCLPRVLANQGYATIAFHPNVPAFWNRYKAYRRIGFQQYWSLRDFVADDLNGACLSDASLYRQVLERVAPLIASGQPLFNYILTFSGHWPYSLANSRPSMISATSQIPEVEAYANNIYYKSRELMVMVEELRRLDPNALIVIFGDHLPYLGNDFAGYIESGYLAKTLADFSPAMIRDHLATPLMIIDGEKGPVPVGDLPLYQLPGLMLDLLGWDLPTIYDYTRPANGLLVRPLPSCRLLILPQGSTEVCRGGEETIDCFESATWIDQVLTVKRDLFTGHQISLTILETLPPVAVPPTLSSAERVQKSL